MCGICGFVGLTDENLLNEMCDIMVHRGPDDRGIYLRNNIGLGHRRLSIIDVEGGHQPMFNEDEKICIVFNGEIYNYLELRQELKKKGHRFRTSSDTEVIVHLYEEEGKNCVNTLNGMFAFAIWDENKQQLFLARDRLGIKPLYYAEMDGKLFFASEIKAILQYKKYSRDVGYSRDVDYKAMDTLLSYLFIPGKRTLFKNIFKLLPGRYIIYKNGHPEIHRYWRYQQNVDYKTTEAEFAEQVYEIIQDAMKIRLMSEVPLGVLLSGGVDSSTIVAVMSQLSNKPIKTFSIGFGEPSDEFQYARLVAERFNTDHHEYIVEYPDMTTLLPEIMWYQEEPINCGALVPTYFLAKTVKERVTVILVGEGPDEVFAGYKRFKFMSPLAGLLPMQIRHWGFLSLLNSYTPEQKKRLYTSKMNDLLNYNYDQLDVYYQYFNAPKSDPLSNLTHFEVEHELPDLQLSRVDKMTMHCSTEVRVPFLDRRLVELAARIPPRLKLKWFNEKYILRKAVKNLLPQVILERRKKGLTTPLGAWFENGFEQMVQTMLSEERLKERGLFQKKFVDELLQKRNHPLWGRKFMYQLLILVFIEYWFDIFIDGTLKVGPINLSDF